MHKNCILARVRMASNIQEFKDINKFISSPYSLSVFSLAT